MDVSFLVGYAPQDSLELQKLFWGHVHRTPQALPLRTMVVFLGDLNAHLPRPAILPWYGNRGLVAKANRNGEELAKVAAEFDFVIFLGEAL